MAVVSTLKLLAAFALQLQSAPHHAHHQAKRAVKSAKLAPIFQAACRHYRIPTEVAMAVAQGESGFNVDAESPYGDLGIMQVRRGGAVPPSLGFLTDKDLKHPWINIWLGVRYLAKMRDRCGGGSPGSWLGAYAGSGCGPSRYADRVLSLMEPAWTTL